MKFGEMLDGASRLRHSGCCGPGWAHAGLQVGGADGSHSTRILQVTVQFSVLERPLRRLTTATFIKIDDFALDADLGPLCPSECDSRI